MAKSKSTVNKAGNYTKPGMRKRMLTLSWLAQRVVNLANGVLEKHNFWQLDIKKQVVATSNDKLYQKNFRYN